MYNNPSTAPYNQYYSTSSTRLIPNCDDRRQDSFSDYSKREVFYNGQAETRLTDTAPIKNSDNHLEANGYYPFTNHVVTKFSNVPPVTSSLSSLPQPQASQMYPAESVNITTNKSYWEWNNNGGSYTSAAMNYNGGIQTYDYPNGTKQQFNGYHVGYPDVLQKDSHGGFNVSSFTLRGHSKMTSFKFNPKLITSTLSNIFFRYAHSAAKKNTPTPHMHDVIFECSVSLELTVNKTTVNACHWYQLSMAWLLFFCLSRFYLFLHFHISFVTIPFSFYFQNAFIFACHIATRNRIISANPPTTHPPVELFDIILIFATSIIG